MTSLTHAGASHGKRSGIRVPELDGLRGIAILLVLCFHFTPSTGPLRFLAPVLQVGWVGVDLFFVLSGFLITGIMLDRKGQPGWYRNFIARRSLRIFPLYYACLALYAVLSYYPSPVRWGHFLNSGDGWWYITYLGNFRVFLQNAWPALYILTPLWSLQVEEQFYLTFPFIVSSLSRGRLRTVLAGSVIAALALRIVLTLVMPENKVSTYVLMPCRMDALAMGGLIAIAQRETPGWFQSRWIPWITGVSAALFVTVCVCFTVAPWSAAMRTLGFTAAGLAFAGLLVMLISYRHPVLSRFFRIRLLCWIGTISYGLYLLHIPASIIASRVVGSRLGLAPHGSAEFFLSIAAAILAAWISWTVFESPILKLKNRITVR
jgi:peptidoglycan/LPS O-acetylase OafA/YrhL